MKKNDILLLVFSLLAAGILFLVFGRPQKEIPGKTAVVYLDGKKIAQYDLSRDGVYELDGEYGYNRISVENGGICVTEADCPDGYCRKTGKKSHSGEQIICLPHHILIEVTGDAESTVDAVVY